MFNTELAPDEEKRFQAWVSFNKVPWKDSPIADYDMRGFWKGLQTGDSDAKTGVSPFDQRLHFPDKWKTPFHDTFSNESIYAGPGAPKWVGDRLIDRNGRILADETPKRSPAPAYGTTPLGRQLTGKPRSPLEGFITEQQRQVSENYPTQHLATERQITTSTPPPAKPGVNPSTVWTSQLGALLGHARTSAPPPELGTTTQLGDISKIAPSSFSQTRGSKVEWYTDPNIQMGGEYHPIIGMGGEFLPASGTIRINNLQKLIDNIPGHLVTKSGEPIDPRGISYMPAVLPHEVGHAIYHELETRVFQDKGAVDENVRNEAVQLISDWYGLHDQFLKENKALGRYQYANEPDHSFADAFAAWKVDPAKFKNLFPEMDTYFKKLAKTK